MDYNQMLEVAQSEKPIRGMFEVWGISPIKSGGFRIVGDYIPYSGTGVGTLTDNWHTSRIEVVVMPYNGKPGFVITQNSLYLLKAQP